MRRSNQYPPNGLYRSRKGVILGVCRGIAEYFDFSVFWARCIALMLLLMSGVWPVLAIYLLAGLLMKPEPVVPIATEEEQEFYDSYTRSRSQASQRLKRRYENLERRIRRMEDAVTAKDFDWDDRLHS
jgi:phage shock protein C